MRSSTARCGLLSLLILSTAAFAAEKTAQWPQFRGTGARGIAEGHATPTTWDAESGENIRWKTAIPGLGHSSPVIWGDRIFLTTAISGKAKPELKVGRYGDIASVKDSTVHRFDVLALDRESGKLLWRQTAHTGKPIIKRHTKASHANSTPATDGKHVVAFFGSEGLFCYDMDGKLLWKKDLGTLDSGYYLAPKAQWGFGSSVSLHDGMILIQADVQKESFLAAYRVEDGSEIWRTQRSDVPTWSTPTVHRDAKRSQVIVNGWKHIGGYDLATGKELWKMKGGGDIPIPTPYVAHDLIFLTSAHGGGIPVYAIKTSATGDIALKEDATSNEHVAWSEPRGGSYMPTSIVLGDYLYVLRDSGILSCYEARTGVLQYKERLPGGSLAFTASLVAADGKIYLTSETGEILVVKAGPEFEILATNEMNEICMATPAISEGTLFFRTRDHLVAVAVSQ